MATRAISIENTHGSLLPRIDGWRAVVDDAFVTAWDDLAADAAEPNAFAESWFLRPALALFDPEGKVRLFSLWEGSMLVGLMPLSRHEHYGRWPMPHWQNWLHHNAFLGTPLVRHGYEHEFWAALLAALDTEPGTALFAHFNGLVPGGPIVEGLTAACRDNGRRKALVHSMERALLTGDVSPEAYFEAAVRGKKRKELRRQKNRLDEEGTVTFTRFADATGIDLWTQEFLTLERAGWKGDNESALDCSDETRTLFAEVLAGAASAGKLERLEMRLDGRPLAMLVNFLCAPGSFGFKTAFDENYARFSPGVLLQIENLAMLSRTDVDWCDSCASEGHPMIDSLWTGRRTIGRYSVAIGGVGRRAVFSALLRAELARGAARKSPTRNTDEGEDV